MDKDVPGYFFAKTQNLLNMIPTKSSGSSAQIVQLHVRVFISLPQLFSKVTSKLLLPSHMGSAGLRLSHGPPGDHQISPVKSMDIRGLNIGEPNTENISFSCGKKWKNHITIYYPKLCFVLFCIKTATPLRLAGSRPCPRWCASPSVGRSLLPATRSNTRSGRPRVEKCMRPVGKVIQQLVSWALAMGP